MKEQESTASFQEKYKYITAQSHRLTPQQCKLLSELSNFADSHQPWHEPTDPQSYSKAIKLETLYKVCMPAIYSLDWAEQINYKTTHPITGIVAFKEVGDEYHSIDQILCTWVESGGTRVVPLPSNLNKEKIDHFLKNVSALVVPELRNQNDLTFLASLAKLIEQHRDLPVLALGNSALVLLGEIDQSQDLKKRVNILNVQRGEDLQVFATHSDPFFSNFNLNVRLEIESKYSIASTAGQLNLKYLAKPERLSVLGLAKDKYETWMVFLARRELLHLCFMEPRLDGNSMENVSLAHRAIIGFMEEARKRERKVEEKQMEVGQFKMCLKGERYHYNCDTKITKN